MKILLINNNPVVSRLTALSARKEDIEIDEIQEVTELNSDTYDIVFVDADSWTKDVRDVISENIKTQKSVLFYGDGDEEEKASFDLSILKPFLPSEVSAVIRSIEKEGNTLDSSIEDENHFNILDEVKVDNRDELFDLDGLDEVEKKKEEINLELEDLSFDDKLEEAFPLKSNILDDVLPDKSKIELNIEENIISEKLEEKITDDNDLFDLDLNDEIPSLNDELFIENDKKEAPSLLEDLELKGEVLEVANDIEDESSFLAFDEIKPEREEVKKETKILDELEIENIKGILTEDISSDMTLEDLMPAMPSIPKIEEDSKNLNEKTIDTLNIESKVLAKTLSTMPIESLRELLAGAKVNIKIKFPKSK